MAQINNKPIPNNPILPGTPVYTADYSYKSDPGYIYRTSLANTPIGLGSMPEYWSNMEYTEYPQKDTLMNFRFGETFGLDAVDVPVKGDEFMRTLINTSLESQGHPFRYIRAQKNAVVKLHKHTELSTAIYCFEQLMDAHAAICVLTGDNTGFVIHRYISDPQLSYQISQIVKDSESNCWVTHGQDHNYSTGEIAILFTDALKKLSPEVNSEKPDDNTPPGVDE